MGGPLEVLTGIGTGLGIIDRVTGPSPEEQAANIASASKPVMTPEAQRINAELEPIVKNWMTQTPQVKARKFTPTGISVGGNSFNFGGSATRQAGTSNTRSPAGSGQTGTIAPNDTSRSGTAASGGGSTIRASSSQPGTMGVTRPADPGSEPTMSDALLRTELVPGVYVSNLFNGTNMGGGVGGWQRQKYLELLNQNPDYQAYLQSVADWKKRKASSEAWETMFPGMDQATIPSGTPETTTTAPVETVQEQDPSFNIADYEYRDINGPEGFDQEYIQNLIDSQMNPMTKAFNVANQELRADMERAGLGRSGFQFAKQVGDTPDSLANIFATQSGDLMRDVAIRSAEAKREDQWKNKLTNEANRQNWWNTNKDLALTLAGRQDSANSANLANAQNVDFQNIGLQQQGINTGMGFVQGNQPAASAGASNYMAALNAATNQNNANNQSLAALLARIGQTGAPTTAPTPAQFTSDVLNPSVSWLQNAANQIPASNYFAGIGRQIFGL